MTMPTTYGTGKLADAIREALRRPFNDAGDPEEYPAWSGNEADYRLHVHRGGDASLFWIIEVRHRGETPRAASSPASRRSRRSSTGSVRSCGRWPNSGASSSGRKRDDQIHRQ